MLQFPYQDEQLKGTTPHSPPSTATYRFRPLIPIAIGRPLRRWQTTKAVLDIGADDTIFPTAIMQLIGAVALPDRGSRIIWQGKRFTIQYAQVRLFMADDVSTYSWQATVAFTPAPLKYPLLGLAGCLQYFDARFRGADRTVELDANWSYPGTT